ncbi:MAG: hypothetical protein ACQKBY_11290 [Verrucomicrobiales bacterium]
MDQDLKKLEAELGKLSPCGMPDDLLARLDEAMCRWHEKVPLEEKIVPLQSRPAPAAAPARPRRLPQLAAAATVTLLGVVSANHFFSQRRPATLADTPLPPASQVSPASAPEAGLSKAGTTFTPKSARTDIVGTADRGLVFLPNGQAARAVAIHYQDELEYANEHGESLKINKPELKLIYLPVETD